MRRCLFALAVLLLACTPAPGASGDAAISSDSASDTSAPNTTPDPACTAVFDGVLSRNPLNFYWWDDTPVPTAQTLSLQALPATCRTIQSDAPWLSLTGSGDAQMVSVRTEGLSAGLHSASLTVRDANGNTVGTLLARLRVFRRPPANAPRRVAVIGLDGARSDALQQANTPVLDFLLQHARYTFAARTQNTAPAVSAPGWMSVFTGVQPMKHGVVANGNYTQRNAMYPTFVQRLGMQGKRILVTSAWQELAETIVEPGRHVETFFGPDMVSARRLANALPTATQEAFFQHLDAPDAAGHFSGFSPMNPTYMQAIESCDRNIGVILDGVLSRPTFANEDWLFAFTTDHGGKGNTHGDMDAENQTIWIILASASFTQQNLTETNITHMDIAPSVYRWLGVTIDPSWNLDGIARVP